MLTSMTRPPPPDHRFPITRWSLIRRACGKENEEADLEALQEVCVAYWSPLYCWARHSGKNLEDAADLIQSFFEKFLANGFLGTADPARGRLRNFLLICLKRHAGDLREKSEAACRDARKTISLDFEWAEGRYHDQASSRDSPETLYDRRWAHTLLHQALAQLEGEMKAAGKGEAFNALKYCLETGSGSAPPDDDLVSKLRLSEPALKSQIHRMRRRFRELLLTRISLTIGVGENPKDELAALICSI